MNERTTKMSSGRYMSAYSPSQSSSNNNYAALPPLIPPRSPAAFGHEKFVAELLAEYEKLTPFHSVLPHSCLLLNREILRVTTLLGNAQILDQARLEHARPLASEGIYSTGRSDVNIWASPHQSEISSPLHHSSPQSWLGSHGNGVLVKKAIRVDIPVDKYPNFNFVCRLLGPGGNSLKRIEASAACRILIRGHGSIKDPVKEQNPRALSITLYSTFMLCLPRLSELLEEMMRGNPGFQHLNEPLHILVEAELPAEIIDARLLHACQILKNLITPVEESQDYFKKEQLRELAMLNGAHSENDSLMSGSVSPFNGAILGMKRAKIHV
ncbi:KH domain-containing protein [Drosera capensis]